MTKTLVKYRIIQKNTDQGVMSQ